MGRAPCCDKANVKRGPWSPEEDNTLRNYLEKHGTGGNWIALPRKAGLRRCGKSCRLRWLNYLRPDIKHGGFTQEEDNTICSLYTSIGSRWSVIAAQLPGRTDNDVKNYWNTKLKKKLLAGKINENSNSGQFSASTPLIKAEADQSTQGFANGNLLDAYHDNFSINSNNGCSSLSSNYMSTDMKQQQDYDYPGEILDQIDEFPMPGLMEVPDKYNYSMSMSSSSNSSYYSSSFPLENNDINYATNWSSNGAGNMLLDFDFDLLGNGSSFQGKSS